MKSKIKYFLVLTVMLLAVSVQAEAYDFVVDGIYYEIASVKDLTCGVVQGGYKYTGDIVIPSQVEYNNRHFKVQEIRSRAFLNCDKLTSIEIPNSVTEIGEDAFRRCSSLTSVEMSNSITKIDDRTFAGCFSLTSVKIPNSVTVIGRHAFSDCSKLTSIEIPDSVTVIGYCAFLSCHSLRDVKLSDSLLGIGESSFQYCISLNTIKIPNSVTEICKYAFGGCSSLTSVEMSNSITKIDDWAFDGCSSLTSVRIPNSLSSIENGVFSGCKSLTSITIPGSVISIEPLAFKECSALKDVNLCNGLKSISYCAFADCVSLQSITIPGSVTELGSKAHTIENSSPFAGCNSLKEVNFLYGPDNLKILIDDDTRPSEGGTLYAFFSQLEKMFIDRVFGCIPLDNIFIFNENIPLPNIRELYIGEHIQNLNIRDIYTCKNLEKIRCYSELPPSCEGFSDKQYMNVMVEVPYSALEAYRSDSVWGIFWNLQGFECSLDVNDLETEESGKSVVGRFDLNGNPVDDEYKGITIIRFSDGSTNKVIM